MFVKSKSYDQGLYSGLTILFVVVLMVVLYIVGSHERIGVMDDQNVLIELKNE